MAILSLINCSCCALAVIIGASQLIKNENGKIYSNYRKKATVTQVAAYILLSQIKLHIYLIRCR
ncbi:exported protein of unknown function [Xenorhabdus nematophila AN6/1]|nr:exported hypothetical protein [Xenorhabdus nematophila str. Anatoliense]CEE93379.1 exported hypothetical protein [Xenorhabdus nematophila str. Anatoliense]CEF30611.1 exported hypothetical protein [Xenorhabdus nematophila str. Websteri]CEF31290.1 exported hypothetical protein [Xenorhabdus nematophila str. Websteri]CEK21935.1 exported protein of unknown function [Xenorhabdus nematophila AN6/1]